MKCKRLLRFYFNAEALNKALDNLIIKLACGGAGGETERCAERMLDLIEAKCRLGELWSYLDGIISRFEEREKEVLKFYGRLKTGVKKLENACRLEIKRVTVRFSRRARNLHRYGEAIRLIGEYYCLY